MQLIFPFKEYSVADQTYYIRTHRIFTCNNAGAEAQFPITEQITLAVTNIVCNTVHNVGPRSILQILINRISEQLHF